MTVGGILLAGGSGSRFGQPKQFLELAAGTRLIDAALDCLLEVANKTVLVLPEGHLWAGAAVHAVVAGGDTRLASVQAGLAALPHCDVIVVHDAGHPLAAVDTARLAIAAVEAGADAAVPWLPVVDVLKRQRPDGSLEAAGRDGLGQAQTPHAFRANVLRALHQGGATGTWEDTQLIEEQGGRVVAVPGDSGNIHVVTPEDLTVVRRLYQSQQAAHD
jgi:2-C-methyl-D-erythritol 4-phosphate cytidylyltransferase